MKIDSSWKVLLLFVANKKQKWNFYLHKRSSEASAIMFQRRRKAKKCRQVNRVFIIYMSFSSLDLRAIAASKPFRSKAKGFSCFMRENKRKTSQNFNPEFSFRRRKTKRNGKGKLSYSALLFQACENIILLCFECSMCLLCSSHRFEERGKQQPESECGYEKMEAKKKTFSAAQKNVIYFFGKMKMSVRERDIRRFVSFPFGLWFVFSSSSICDEKREGIKALSRLAWWRIFVSTSLSTETLSEHLRALKSLSCHEAVRNLSWEIATRNVLPAFCNLPLHVELYNSREIEVTAIVK